MKEKIKEAARLIRNSKHTTVFTGAGISVESGIPPFRGEGGLWGKYNPELLDIGFFHTHPHKSWNVIKEVFYDYFGRAVPNAAHKAVARLEELGYVKAVITQNVDNLHQLAGSKTVFEFHGTSRTISCLTCRFPMEAAGVSLETLPPHCPQCNGIMKPDFIFFGEGIPREAALPSYHEAQVADVFIVIGTTGEVMPACEIPFQAKHNGAQIIEINTQPSAFTPGATDIFLRGKASEMMTGIMEEIEG